MLAYFELVVLVAVLWILLPYLASRKYPGELRKADVESRVQLARNWIFIARIKLKELQQHLP